MLAMFYFVASNQMSLEKIIVIYGGPSRINRQSIGGEPCLLDWYVRVASRLVDLCGVFLVNQIPLFRFVNIHFVASSHTSA